MKNTQLNKIILNLNYMKNTQLNKEKLELFLEDVIQKRFKMPKSLRIGDCIEVRYDTDMEKYEATLDRTDDFKGYKLWSNEGEIAEFMKNFYCIDRATDPKDFLEQVMQNYLDHEINRLKEDNTLN